MWSQPWTLLDHRRMRAEAAIHLGELQAYVTSPDDDEMFRHGVEFENSDISQVVDVGQPRHVGHGRSSADVEEHLAGLEQSTVDLASELTTMIEAERNYTANSKVFQTGSELMEVLVNLKR